MAQKWQAEDFDQCYRQEKVGFEDGYAHAARQGIPRFIEEYRISRVKDAIAPWIVGEQGGEEGGQKSEVGGRRSEAGGRKVLDLGCGNGWYPIRLVEKWGFEGQIIGVDVSSLNIELFNKEIQEKGLDQISSMVGNVEELPFENEFFDIVYATETMEHVENPEKVFAEAYRVLKPGGEFIITTPSGPLHRFWNGFFYLPKMIKRLFVKPTKGNHIYDCPMSFRELKKYISQAGFSLINYHKAVFLTHESYIKFFPRPLQYLMLFKARLMECFGPLTMFWGLHHIIRLKK